MLDFVLFLLELAQRQGQATCQTLNPAMQDGPNLHRCHKMLTRFCGYMPNRPLPHPGPVNSAAQSTLPEHQAISDTSQVLGSEGGTYLEECLIVSLLVITSTKGLLCTN